jgi:hypothetical protein
LSPAALAFSAGATAQLRESTFVTNHPRGVASIVRVCGVAVNGLDATIAARLQGRRLALPFKLDVNAWDKQ